MNPMPANHVIPWASSCRKAKMLILQKESKQESIISHQLALKNLKTNGFFGDLYDMIFQIQKRFILCCQSFNSMRNLYMSSLKQSRTGHTFFYGWFCNLGVCSRAHLSSCTAIKHFQTSRLCKGKRRFCQLGPPAVWGVNHSQNLHFCWFVFMSSSWRTSTTSLEC